MRLANLLTLLLISGMCAHGQQKQVCFTVDDLPVVSYGNASQEFLEEITDKFVATFDKYTIPAIGYVNEKKLYVDQNVDQNKVQLLEKWLSAGYDLGNHTYSHTSYHRSSFDKFTKDVMNGAIITRPLAKRHGKDVAYFRHPYLHIGKTKEGADSLHLFLESEGYQEAPVTIDPDDYLFAKLYHVAIHSGDTDMAKEVGEAYLTHMENKIHYYENLSQQLFGGNIAQTLLIHANLLNADYLDEVAEIFLRNGYSFISQEDVLQDLLYKEPVTKFGDWGISWLDRWTISKKKYDLLKNDPKVPEFISGSK